MLDIKFLRENVEKVKDNIRKKFQNEKLPLVDEVVELDEEYRKIKTRCDQIRADRNRISKQIGSFMANGDDKAAAEAKQQVKDMVTELDAMKDKERILADKVRKIMLIIPNMIDDSVPIGKDDSENVELKKFGEPSVPDYEVPYHVDIMERFCGIDLDSARKNKR